MIISNFATDDQIAELRDLVLRATPGPWLRDPTESTRYQVIANENRVVAYHCQHIRQTDAQVVPDFGFIAAANPTTVLALLDRMDTERARADAAEAEARSENERRIENNSAAWCERDAAWTECERLRAALEKIRGGGMPIGADVNALDHILAMCGIAAEALYFKVTK